jgi:hypothetical protein
MKSEFLIGIFALAGSIVGAAATIISASLTSKRSDLKIKLLELARQVQAYHKLEGLYKVELAIQLGKAQDTVMKDMRDKVEAAGAYTRPKMTQGEAKRIIEKLQ